MLAPGHPLLLSFGECGVFEFCYSALLLSDYFAMAHALDFQFLILTPQVSDLDDEILQCPHVLTGWRASARTPQGRPTRWPYDPRP